ncbi:hypothetical protein R2601_03718 [Salipiger bermudensis HTCC2601]|uniref:Uncharacterized protein n=1 Tax=Salipiger bermudensis (strain DSM 26914 / JCM 13377 / KCTC 12554 / HTCC2601) TaxID=314265 RepID=Q0FWA2_SALBH|nr:hypothetical protein R2601_03718 [Salipiger bermudensis HTCC2601]
MLPRPVPGRCRRRSPRHPSPPRAAPPTGPPARGRRPQAGRARSRPCGPAHNRRCLCRRPPPRHRRSSARRAS